MAVRRPDSRAFLYAGQEAVTYASCSPHFSSVAFVVVVLPGKVTGLLLRLTVHDDGQW